MVAVTPSGGRPAAPSAERSVHTFGRNLTDQDREREGAHGPDDRSRAFSQRACPGVLRSRKQHIPLTAGPDEVLSFQVPTTFVDGGVGERLSVRVQVRQIR